jgi:cytoskeletal protein RodZ
MSRLHSTLIALVLGSVVVAGLFAAAKTVRLGQNVSAPKRPVAVRELAFRQAKLDRWSRSLRAERAKRPPALPKVPKFAPVPSPQAAAPATSAAAPAASQAEPQVRYVRPKPVVKYQRAAGKLKTMAASSQQSWSDDDAATESSGSSDDGGSTGGDD